MSCTLGITPKVTLLRSASTPTGTRFVPSPLHPLPHTLLHHLAPPPSHTPPPPCTPSLPSPPPPLWPFAPHSCKIAILEEMLLAISPATPADAEAAEFLGSAAAHWGRFFHYGAPSAAGVPSTSAPGPASSSSSRAATTLSTASTFSGASSKSETSTTPASSAPSAPRDEATLFEQLLFEHSALVVPHLDAVAARPVAHAFAAVSPHDPRLGLHFVF